jgi:hypothetical protein
MIYINICRFLEDHEGTEESWKELLCKQKSKYQNPLFPVPRYVGGLGFENGKNTPLFSAGYI